MPTLPDRQLCRRISSACALLFVFTSTAPQIALAASDSVDLAKLEGWDIVVASEPSASEAYAAEELQRFLGEATGRKIPVVKTADGDEHHFFVGPSAAHTESNVAFSVDSLGEEDLRIVIRDGNIAIAGGPPRGTLYGVYVFLEDYVGVRFLTHDHTHVPPVGVWRVVGPIDRTHRPTFAMRWSYYGEINRRPVFAARTRTNTVSNDAKLGGKTGLQNINHSFARQIPTATYGEENPEYFALVGGKRLASVKSDSYGSEPCLTNPDVRGIITEAVLREIDGRPQLANVSVSQNDNNKYCRCESCAELDAREGTPMGSLLTLVNSVADAVAAKGSDVKVGTLAYWYTRHPPKHLRPRPNVQIQLCSIECCILHPIDDPSCPKNVEFCRDMRDWGAICDNVSIWNYNTNFTNYLLPCPNLRSIERNVRFFAANGAKGVFMQAAGNAWGAELSELRNYVISRLLWDPTQQGERLIDEFLALHYGKAAPAIRRYVDLVHDTAQASGKHRNCFGRGAADYGIDLSVTPRALALFEDALAAAESDEIIRRVERASISVYRLAIDPVWYASDPKTVNADTLAAARPHIERFLELCEKHGVDRAQEHKPFATDKARLEALLRVDESTN